MNKAKVNTRRFNTRKCLISTTEDRCFNLQKMFIVIMLCYIQVLNRQKKLNYTYIVIYGNFLQLFLQLFLQNLTKMDIIVNLDTF